MDIPSITNTGQASAAKKADFRQKFARQVGNPYARLDYSLCIKEIENLLFDDKADKNKIADVFEVLVEHHGQNPRFGYDATRLIEHVWKDASPELALQIMGNLTLLKNKTFLNSFYQTIAERMANRLEKGGYTDVVNQLSVMMDLTLRRGHSSWYKSYAGAYIGIFNQIMGDKDFIDPSIGLLPSVWRIKQSLGQDFDDNSFNFITDFLDTNRAGRSGIIFAALYDIFETGIEISEARKEKLLAIVLNLSSSAPAFYPEPEKGIHQFCHFFSNFMDGDKKYHAQGLQGLDQALRNLRNLFGKDAVHQFAKTYSNHPSVSDSVSAHLKGYLKERRPNPTP